MTRGQVGRIWDRCWMACVVVIGIAAPLSVVQAFFQSDGHDGWITRFVAAPFVLLAILLLYLKEHGVPTRRFELGSEELFDWREHFFRPPPGWQTVAAVQVEAVGESVELAPRQVFETLPLYSLEELLKIAKRSDARLIEARDAGGRLTWDMVLICAEEPDIDRLLTQMVDEGSRVLMTIEEAGELVEYFFDKDFIARFPKGSR